MTWVLFLDSFLYCSAEQLYGLRYYCLSEVYLILVLVLVLVWFDIVSLNNYTNLTLNLLFECYFCLLKLHVEAFACITLVDRFMKTTFGSWNFGILCPPESSEKPTMLKQEKETRNILFGIPIIYMESQSLCRFYSPRQQNHSFWIVEHIPTSLCWVHIGMDNHQVKYTTIRCNGHLGLLWAITCSRHNWKSNCNLVKY